MKRLLWYLNQITDTDTVTFRYTVIVDGNAVQKEIYDGECSVSYLKPGGDRDGDRTGIRQERGAVRKAGNCCVTRKFAAKI